MFLVLTFIPIENVKVIPESLPSVWTCKLSVKSFTFVMADSGHDFLNFLLKIILNHWFYCLLLIDCFFLSFLMTFITRKVFVACIRGYCVWSWTSAFLSAAVIGLPPNLINVFRIINSYFIKAIDNTFYGLSGFINPLEMLGGHSKSCDLPPKESWFTSFFSRSPIIPRAWAFLNFLGLGWRL